MIESGKQVIVQHHGRQGLASLLGLGQGQAYAKAGSRSDLEGPASPLPVSLVVPASQVRASPRMPRRMELSMSIVTAWRQMALATFFFFQQCC